MYNDQQPNPGSWQEEEQRMTPPPKRGNAFSSFWSADFLSR